MRGVFLIFYNITWGGGGVYRDPKFVLRNKWMAPHRICIIKTPFTKYIPDSDIVYVFVSFDDDVIGVCERASSKHHFPGISLIAPPPVTPGKRLSQTTLCSRWWWWCLCWCWRRWWHDNWWVWLIGSSLWLTSKFITTESTENNDNVLLLIKVETRSFQRDSGCFF